MGFFRVNDVCTVSMYAMDAQRANLIKGRNPLRASNALRSALAKRAKSPGTITYFFSSKNNQDILLSTDLEFAHALLCEADENVKSYESDTDRVIAFVENEGYIGSKPDAIVKFWSGQVEYRKVMYLGGQGQEHALLQAEVQKRAAETVGAGWAWFSEKDVVANERLFHDWLHIAPVLAQSRIDVKARWEFLAKWVLEESREGTNLGNLHRRAQDPWELVFSATFRLIQLGRLSSDLQTKPLSSLTAITPRVVRNG
jgi:hypothetical protein